MNRVWFGIAATVAAFTMACGGAAAPGGAQPPANPTDPAATAGSTPTTASTDSTPPATTPTTSPGGASPDAQIATGKTLYLANCQTCHGADGTGGNQGDPAVVGIKTGALPVTAKKPSNRTAQLNTAGDLFQYIKTTMPEDNPATMKDDEYLAVTAWILSANSVAMTAPLDATNAASIKLH